MSLFAGRRAVVAARRRLSAALLRAGPRSLQVVRDYHRRTTSLVERLAGLARAEATAVDREGEATGSTRDEALHRYLGDRWSNERGEWDYAARLGFANSEVAAGVAVIDRHMVTMAPRVTERADATDEEIRWLSLSSMKAALEELAQALEAEVSE